MKRQLSQSMRLASAIWICAIVVADFCAADARAQGNIRVSGIAEIVAQSDDSRLYLNRNNLGDSNFDPLRARLFIEGGTDRTQIYLQTLFSQESAAPFRLYGAYLLHRVFESADIYLEAGLVPVHDGIWAPETYSDQNPLIAVPMAYYWKSDLHSRQLPVDIDQLVSARGQGQHGFVYADSTGQVRGKPFHSAPIVYDACWNYGAFTLGSFRRLEWALGVTVGSPSDPVSSTDTNENLSLHGRLGYAITPGLKVYASAAHGAYLSEDVAPYLPADKSVNDYKQTVLVGSASWNWGYFSFMGEAFFNHYTTPIRSDGLSNIALWGQVVWKFRPGWYMAARYDGLHFEEVETSAGPQTWDNNVRRIEAGVGYHISRELLAKAVLQHTDEGNGWANDNLIKAFQLSFSF